MAPLGLVYTGIAIAGFAIGNHEELLNLVPINTEDDFLHLAIGLSGLAAGLATPAIPRPTTDTRIANSE